MSTRRGGAGRRGGCPFSCCHPEQRLMLREDLILVCHPEQRLMLREDLILVCHPEQRLMLREDLILCLSKNGILTSSGKTPDSSE